jgi:hypothetical protein
LAISVNTGAMALHGPHHSAQKSTTIGVVADLTVSSKFALVKVMIPSAMFDPLVKFALFGCFKSRHE